ncbi:polymer-forming cytoskeletal protein [Myxococcota bacterium]|nr:polymer-forming cytoskeletal protein [Myxococcota bacterium]MBU1382377.1 polymer-forming cytoskeletal protein [Myxococcota bacterium]MBU1498713.1 polymer-forming cytoskeletal protein [Myxococcota bacterium]
MKLKKQHETSEINTLIGEGTSFKGELSFEGTVRIDGTLSGNIKAPSATLIVGSKGKVEGDIVLKEFNLSGHFNGKAEVTEITRLSSSSNFTGELHTQEFQVESGAQFNGTCKMMHEQLKPNTKSK